MYPDHVYEMDFEDGSIISVTLLVDVNLWRSRGSILLVTVHLLVFILMIAIQQIWLAGDQI